MNDLRVVLILTTCRFAYHSSFPLSTNFPFPQPQEFEAVLTTSIDAIGAYSQNNPDWNKVSKKLGIKEADPPSWVID